MMTAVGLVLVKIGVWFSFTKKIESLRKGGRN